MKNVPPIIVEIPSDELGGASGARLFRVLAVGKRNSPQFPYCVANEKIATEIGRALARIIHERREMDKGSARSGGGKESDGGLQANR